jgi:hypothetical protein
MDEDDSIDDNPARHDGWLMSMATDRDFMELIRLADVIYAAERVGHEAEETSLGGAVKPGPDGTIAMFFGLNLMRSIAKGCLPESAPRILRVPIDFESNDVALLLVMVESIKGSSCFNDHDLGSPSAN